MKQLVCYTVEGLLRQGPHQVWVTLGAYRSLDQAQSAQRLAPAARFSETRILPYFRSCESGPSMHWRPTVRPAAPAAEAAPSVVA